MTKYTEHRALQDMAVELICWMKEHKDSASYEMVEQINKDLDLGVDDELLELSEMLEW